MCIGVPGQIRSIDGEVATVDCWGTSRQVLLHLLEEPAQVGDWVRKVPPEDVAPLLAMFEQLRAS
jgi:HupF/HypC family